MSTPSTPPASAQPADAAHPAPDQPGTPHAADAQGGSLNTRLTHLRAGVLGANDGIVSVAGILMGVAGATRVLSAIVIAGVAGLSSGALSMAVGEYVSVSSQLDTEKSLLAKERRELEEMPEAELEELTGLYEEKGLSRELAQAVATELTRRDALTAHAREELGIDPEELAQPVQAGIASMISFLLGGALPFLVMVLSPAGVRLWATLIAVPVALAFTGWASATMGQAPKRPAIVRNVVGGLIAMGISFGIGTLVGKGIGPA